MLNCESFVNLSGTTEKILFFGRCHEVKPYSEAAMVQAIKSGLYFYCKAQDDSGNVYSLFSDYDPCLLITKTIAFKH